MENYNYTIEDQNQYFDCVGRLQYLMNKQPQTEGMKKEIQLIQTAIEKFRKNHINMMISRN